LLPLDRIGVGQPPVEGDELFLLLRQSSSRGRRRDALPARPRASLTNSRLRQGARTFTSLVTLATATRHRRAIREGKCADQRRGYVRLHDGAPRNRAGAAPAVIGAAASRLLPLSAPSPVCRESHWRTRLDCEGIGLDGARDGFRPSAPSRKAQGKKPYQL
jgi:hypothetical protein